MSRPTALLLTLLLGGALLVAAALATRGSGPVAVQPGGQDLVLAGRVVRVIDGDGARLRLDSGPIEVRLYGIDAPELRAPRGREARQALEKILARRSVEVVPVSQDQYERMVAVLLVDGQSAGELMLERGHAWAYRQHLGQVEGDERYCQLEAEARTARRGLWSQPPQSWLPPWSWRARERGQRFRLRDYSSETAADCQATVDAARRKRRAARPTEPAADTGAVGLQPLPDESCRIKGNINRQGDKIYHLSGSASYDSTVIDTTRGERWFCSEEEARTAGWRAPRPAAGPPASR